LTHVTRGSPADLSGLRPGDRLFWYQETGQKEYQGIEGSYVPFVNSVKATASRESAAKRTLNLVGLDGRGQRFEKSIALCPGALEASADVGALARSLRSGS